eukprot:m.290903 g.290903  ORF g.290903 m.290903 type:complete len:241 (+) comp12375_c0_seq1:89-811(+)
MPVTSTILVLLAAAFAVPGGAAAQQLCWPSQFHSSGRLLIHSDASTFVAESGTYSYDADSHKAVASFSGRFAASEGNCSSSRTVDATFSIYMLGSERYTAVKLPIVPQQCTRGPNEAFNPVCISTAAAKEGVLGGDGDSLATKSVSYGNAEASMTVMLTASKGAPVTVSGFNTTGTRQDKHFTITQIDFANVVEGIPDPSVFNLPHACKSSALLAEEQSPILAAAHEMARALQRYIQPAP